MKAGVEDESRGGEDGVLEDREEAAGDILLPGLANGDLNKLER